MKSYVLSILSAVLFVAGVSAQTITLNTPLAAVLCNPVSLTWVGGTAAFTVNLLDASQGNEVVETYHTSQSSSFTTPQIPANITVGDNIYWTIVDSTGATGETAPVKVQAGGSDCSSSSGNSTTGSTPTTTTPTSTGSVQTKTTTNTPVSPTSKTSTSTSNPTSTSTSTSTSSPNAAMPTSIPYGAAGILGAVVVAVFA